MHAAQSDSAQYEHVFCTTRLPEPTAPEAALPLPTILPPANTLWYRCAAPDDNVAAHSAAVRAAAASDSSMSAISASAADDGDDDNDDDTDPGAREWWCW